MTTKSRKYSLLPSSDMTKLMAKVPKIFDADGVDVTPLPLLVREGDDDPDDRDNTVTSVTTNSVVLSTIGTPLPRPSVVPLEIGPGKTVSKFLRDFANELNYQPELAPNQPLVIRETEIFWLMDQVPSIVCKAAAEEFAATEARNKEYKELLVEKQGKDLFVERSMNTFTRACISEAVQTDAVRKREGGTWVTDWDMHDTWAAEAARQTHHLADKTEAEQEEEKEEPEVVAVEDSGDELALKRDEESDSGSSDKSAEKAKKLLAKLPLEPFQQQAIRLERALTLNYNFERLLLAEGNRLLREEPAEGQSPERASVEVLWKLFHASVKGRNVAALAWHPRQRFLCAVGYGQFEFDSQKQGGGLCCVWSLKNTVAPERVFHTPASVTAVAWSTTHPNLLACGQFDGSILVYDVREARSPPVLNTTESPGRHLGVVRSLEFVPRKIGAQDYAVDFLVSIAHDGRVVEWSLRKGHAHSNLMMLKRMPNNLTQVSCRGRAQEGITARLAMGTCIAFSPKEAGFYLVGTDSGNIHKCSVSYKEQYLFNYTGHTAAVYQLEWSPHVPDVFASCSADWTVKIWHVDEPTAVMSLQSNINAVNGIAWSPDHSAVLIATNENKVELWSLEQSLLDPVAVEALSQDFNATLCRYGSQNQMLLVGDSQGAVHTCVIRNLRLKEEASRGEALLHQLQLVRSKRVADGPACPRPERATL